MEHGINPPDLGILLLALGGQDIHLNCYSSFFLDAFYEFSAFLYSRMIRKNMDLQEALAGPLVPANTNDPILPFS